MHRLYKRSICYSYNCTSLVRSSVSVSKAASGTKENRMKSRGFGSRGKELRPRVWNKGIQQNLSRGTVTRRVLLEEKKECGQTSWKTFLPCSCANQARRNVFSVFWIPTFQTPLLVIFRVFPFLYFTITHSPHSYVFSIPVFLIPAFQTGPNYSSVNH